jgi:hypothetical protein
MVKDMKTRLFRSVAFVSFLLVQAGAAQAQFYGYSSTAAEGFLHGTADQTRAWGEFNLHTSQAAINYQNAYSRGLDNCQKGIETRFEMQRMNESRRAERRPRQSTPEEISRRNRERLPQRLSVLQFDPATGAIRWQGWLENDEYASGRAELSRLFAERQNGDSGAGTPSCREIKRTVEVLKRQLAHDAKRISIDEFAPSKKFLDSLAYEARFASVGPTDVLAAK